MSDWHRSLAGLHEAAAALPAPLDIPNAVLAGMRGPLEDLFASHRAIADLVQPDPLWRALAPARDLARSLEHFDRVSKAIREAMGPVTLPIADELEKAMREADFIRSLRPPPWLEQTHDVFGGVALKLVEVHAQPWWRSELLEPFAHLSTFSDMLAASAGVDRELRSAVGHLRSITPEWESLIEWRKVLDAAGLTFRRWPRLLSPREQLQRLNKRLAQHEQPPHVRKAKAHVHRHERLLRDVVAAAMETTYGPDWAAERLPLCDGKRLLARARDEGGDPLDYADYYHYRRLMTHAEHFADVFSDAFDDPQGLDDLLKLLGDLRAASHHAGRKFGAKDLTELRAAWAAIKRGLAALTPFHDD